MTVEPQVSREHIMKTAREIWSDDLSVVVDDDTNYFEAGGHSFLAMQTVAKLDAVYGSQLPLRVLFDSPRFGDFVDAVVFEFGA
jgi:hypothetical protein